LQPPIVYVIRLSLGLYAKCIIVMRQATHVSQVLIANIYVSYCRAFCASYWISIIL